MNITKIVHFDQGWCIILHLERRHCSGAVSPLLYSVSPGGPMTLLGAWLLRSPLLGYLWLRRVGVGNQEPNTQLCESLRSGLRSEESDCPINPHFPPGPVISAALTHHHLWAPTMASFWPQKRFVLPTPLSLLPPHLLCEDILAESSCLPPLGVIRQLRAG